MEVGVLGMGIMGKALTTNLIRNGFNVTVWNRTLSKCEEFVKQGASIGETPAAVVNKCDITFAILGHPAAALSVVFDKDGVLEQMRSGKGYIDMSTIDPETSTKISQGITSKGGQFLEAPVSGSKKPAEDGQLVVLAAGDESLYERALPTLNIIGKKCFFLGKVGNGAKMKLAVNMIIGGAMSAFSEGLVLAGKSGLNPYTLLDVMDLDEISTPMFRVKGPLMVNGNHSNESTVKILQKDVKLALALGDQFAVSMPLAAAANETYKKLLDMGLGDLDISALYQPAKKL